MEIIANDTSLVNTNLAVGRNHTSASVIPMPTKLCTIGCALTLKSNNWKNILTGLAVVPDTCYNRFVDTYLWLVIGG